MGRPAGSKNKNQIPSPSIGEQVDFLPYHVAVVVPYNMGLETQLYLFKKGDKSTLTEYVQKVVDNHFNNPLEF